MALSRLGSRIAIAGLVLVVAVALALFVASFAAARPDALGGDSFTAAYAPYTAGPVVSEIEQYAPYEAGPVIHPSDLVAESAPYAPYTAGPVVSEIEQYAPYEAGPVIHPSDLEQ